MEEMKALDLSWSSVLVVLIFNRPVGLEWCNLRGFTVTLVTPCVLYFVKVISSGKDEVKLVLDASKKLCA